MTCSVVVVAVVGDGEEQVQAGVRSPVRSPEVGAPVAELSLPSIHCFVGGFGFGAEAEMHCLERQD